MNNKLIAEFMGMKPHHQDSGCLTRVDDNGSNEVVPIEELAYHTSWDWLMPVVHKIGDENLLSIHMYAVYDRVVEFIEGLSVESVEPDTKSLDESFFAGFCHALEYAKSAIQDVDEIEVDIEESVGDLNISGTVSVELCDHFDADNMIDDIMRRYERDTPKDGSNA